MGVENLNAIAGCQSLLQQWGELLRELLPVLLPNLLLKAMQDLRDGAEDWGGELNFRPGKVGKMFTVNLWGVFVYD